MNQNVDFITIQNNTVTQAGGSDVFYAGVGSDCLYPCDDTFSPGTWLDVFPDSSIVSQSNYEPDLVGQPNYEPNYEYMG